MTFCGRAVLCTFFRQILPQQGRQLSHAELVILIPQRSGLSSTGDGNSLFQVGCVVMDQFRRILSAIVS